MARASLRRQKARRQSLRKRLMVVAVSAGLVFGPMHWAMADYPVYDGTLLAKAGEQLAEAKKAVQLVTDQLKTLKEQLSFLTDIQKFVNDTFEAIGEMGSITLPIIGLVKNKGNLSKTLGCMFDPSKMIPDIDFENIDFGNLCSARGGFRKALVGDSREMASMPLAQQNERRQQIRERRDAIHASAAIEALSLGTVTSSTTIKTMGTTIDQLEDAASSAKTVNDRLAVLIKVQLASLQAQADALALQSAELRLKGASEVRSGVSSDAILPDDSDSSGGW